MPPFLPGISFSELKLKYMKQRPQAGIVHSFDEAGRHQHHKMKHHMKDREAGCNHNAPVFVNLVSAPLQRQMHLPQLWTTSTEYPSSVNCVEAHAQWNDVA